MKFWDSSAIVPLLIEESSSERIREILRQDPMMFVWVLTPVECFSALYRRNRVRKIDVPSLNRFRANLQALQSAWIEIAQIEMVKVRAERLLASHPLRAADALQLAGALAAFEENPSATEFVTLDSNLAEAATKTGFVVVPG